MENRPFFVLKFVKTTVILNQKLIILLFHTFICTILNASNILIQIVNYSCMHLCQYFVEDRQYLNLSKEQRKTWISGWDNIALLF